MRRLREERVKRLKLHARATSKQPLQPLSQEGDTSGELGSWSTSGDDSSYDYDSGSSGGGVQASADPATRAHAMHHPATRPRPQHTTRTRLAIARAYLATVPGERSIRPALRAPACPGACLHVTTWLRVQVHAEEALMAAADSRGMNTDTSETDETDTDTVGADSLPAVRSCLAGSLARAFVHSLVRLPPPCSLLTRTYLVLSFALFRIRRSSRSTTCRKTTCLTTTASALRCRPEPRVLSPLPALAPRPPRLLRRAALSRMACMALGTTQPHGPAHKTPDCRDASERPAVVASSLLCVTARGSTRHAHAGARRRRPRRNSGRAAAARRGAQGAAAGPSRAEPPPSPLVAGRARPPAV